MQCSKIEHSGKHLLLLPLSVYFYSMKQLRDSVTVGAFWSDVVLVHCRAASQHFLLRPIHSSE